jgi:hypothetical protein
MSASLRLVVLGMMGRSPFGGQTWLYLNWLRAFSRMGHDVYYVEDDCIWPYDPEQDTATSDCRYAVRHIASCMERIGLPDKWAFRLAPPPWSAGEPAETWGMSALQLDELYRSSDALLNVVGATALRADHLAAPYRVYVQCDPVTVELQLAAGDEKTWVPFENHDVILTYGENYGAPDCDVPLGERAYFKTRQPVDLDLWPMCYGEDARYFTTIGNYRQSGMDVEYRGDVYHWSKHHEWEKFLEIPRRTSQPFELALKIDDPADRARLEDHGWRTVPPLPMSLDVFGAYPDYIRGSRGELTVAKDQNVRLRSGWFSERDACYLASGKPVVAQDTGFSNVLPTGEGLFAFSSTDEAVAAVEQINADYPRHCRAAREVAAEYFEAARVGADLLEQIGLG